MTKITCEICKTKTRRLGVQKRIFMAKFPLDTDRCRQWVAATGNQDLIHVPVEKLHQLKYICGKHFRLKDYKKKKTQLRKTAVPSIDISTDPLTEDMMKDFPLNMARDKAVYSVLTDHEYCLLDKQDTTYCKEVLPSVTLTTDAVDPGAPLEFDADADDPLEDNILNILSDKSQSFSASIHKDIVARWSDILLNGLKEETIKSILNSYDVPENLKEALPPLLNPEIKAAVNESFVKQDDILRDKQKHLACAISCIASLMTNLLNDKTLNNNDGTTEALKQLNNSGRILCYLHNAESNTRKQFLLSGLSKKAKDNIKDSKRDQWLFGTELAEKLQSMKAISKTRAEMKATSTAARPKAPFRTRQPEASTSRALSSRNPPPAPQSPVRRTTRPPKQLQTTITEDAQAGSLKFYYKNWSTSDPVVLSWLTH